ncbi:hypothetical protein BWQ96_10846 [Gracilariopsis chorda]|uniref:Uncharacterized protein n=1 Tax=Gracilariopsis chorda TaxID=448386 RepID=A0A2V3IBP2_9FLOR|nr:hypothetical protein BWQ96_10846 [Gracilariopsis chorda]|eukprot:PXF39468.1 hypothetical protein BWQ96_10846 [Gracilariopsis chorda]
MLGDAEEFLEVLLDTILANGRSDSSSVMKPELPSG